MSDIITGYVPPAHWCSQYEPSSRVRLWGRFLHSLKRKLLLACPGIVNECGDYLHAVLNTLLLATGGMLHDAVNLGRELYRNPANVPEVMTRL